MPEVFFDRFSEKPVDVRPFDPRSKQRALVYREELDQVLAPHGVSAELFGSTDLEIATKGEWEFGVWLNDENWFPVLITLINHFRSIYTLSDDFALFAASCEDTEVEIIPMRRERAALNRAFMAYMRGHPEACKAYAQGKLDHAYSGRAYMRWKDDFIAGILETV